MDCWLRLIGRTEDVDKLLGTIRDQIPDLDAKPPPSKKPVVKPEDVPNGASTDELFDEVLEQLATPKLAIETMKAIHKELSVMADKVR